MCVDFRAHDLAHTTGPHAAPSHRAPHLSAPSMWVQAKASVTFVQGVRHALADVRHALADERDLVAVNDHPDEVRDAAKKEKDKVELRGLALASKRRCSQTQREAKRATHGSYG